MPESGSLAQIRLPSNFDRAPRESYGDRRTESPSTIDNTEYQRPYNDSAPVIVNEEDYDDLEVVEENLSLDNMEKRVHYESFEKA